MDNRKQRLLSLGPEPLAEALLELADFHPAVDDRVERLIATPEENIRRFKAKLAGLKRSRRFIPWGESVNLARELETLLDDLKSAVDDPVTGAGLVVSFYETDHGTLGRCDDSSGHVGDVYRISARTLFVDYARRCDDKQWLIKQVIKLNRHDDYGVRDTLIDCAAEYLPEPAIRTMIDTLQQSAESENDSLQKRHWLYSIASLARQINDAPLYEKTRISERDNIPTATCVDIARVYLESGEPETALLWLERIPETENFRRDEREHLLVDIHGRLGNAGTRTELAWRIFRRAPSAPALDKLLAVIGEEQREAVIDGEAERILKRSDLSTADLEFLMDTGRLDAAENHLFKHADELNGDFYASLLPIAKAMEADNRLLAATAVYRALLDSILRRAKSKTYSHGARYLKKLDQLAGSITDWRHLPDHDAYTRQLREQHGRKPSFWARYGG